MVFEQQDPDEERSDRGNEPAEPPSDPQSPPPDPPRQPLPGPPFGPDEDLEDRPFLEHGKRRGTFLEDKREEILERLEELRVLVDEYNRLETAAAALAGLGAGSTAAATTRRRGPGRPRGSGKKGIATAAAPHAVRKPGQPPKRRAGRRKRGGTRAVEARSFVQGQPGITIPELAAKMGIKRNYLYRLLPDLEREGQVEKKGRGWYPRT